MLTYIYNNLFNFIIFKVPPYPSFRTPEHLRIRSEPDLRHPPAGVSDSRSASAGDEYYGGARSRRPSGASLTSTSLANSNPPPKPSFSPVSGYQPFQTDPFGLNPWSPACPPSWLPGANNQLPPCLDPIMEQPLAPPGEESVILPPFYESTETVGGSILGPLGQQEAAPAESSISILRGLGLDLSVPQLGLSPPLVDSLLLQGALDDRLMAQQLEGAMADAVCRLELVSSQDDQAEVYRQACVIPQVKIIIKFSLPLFVVLYEGLN